MCKGRLIEFSIYSLSVCGQRRQSRYQVFLKKKKKKKSGGAAGSRGALGPPAHARRGSAPLPRRKAGPREIRRRGPAQPAAGAPIAACSRLRVGGDGRTTAALCREETTVSTSQGGGAGSPAKQESRLSAQAPHCPRSDRDRLLFT